MVAVWTEPIPLRDDHEGGAEAGGVVASITAVTQQDPLRVVPVSCNIRNKWYYVKKKKKRQEVW
jgi:hypothetical protein